MKGNITDSEYLKKLDTNCYSSINNILSKFQLLNSCCNDYAICLRGSATNLTMTKFSDIDLLLIKTKMSCCEEITNTLVKKSCNCDILISFIEITFDTNIIEENYHSLFLSLPHLVFLYGNYELYQKFIKKNNNLLKALSPKKLTSFYYKDPLRFSIVDFQNGYGGFIDIQYYELINYWQQLNSIDNYPEDRYLNKIVSKIKKYFVEIKRQYQDLYNKKYVNISDFPIINYKSKFFTLKTNRISLLATLFVLFLFINIKMLLAHVRFY